MPAVYQGHITDASETVQWTDSAPRLRSIMLSGPCYRCRSRGSQRGSDNKQLGFLGRIWMAPKPELFYNTLPFSDNIRKMAVTSRIRLSHQKEIRKKKSRMDEFISSYWHQRWLQPKDDRLLNNVSISVFIPSQKYIILNACLPPSYGPTNSPWGWREARLMLPPPWTPNHDSLPSKYSNICQIGHFNWTLCSGPSLCHWCSPVSHRLLSYVKETYVPTAHTIIIRELDLQVDQDTYKVDQGRLDDVGVQT